MRAPVRVILELRFDFSPAQVTGWCTGLAPELGLAIIWECYGRAACPTARVDNRAGHVGVVDRPGEAADCVHHLLTILTPDLHNVRVFRSLLDF